MGYEDRRHSREQFCEELGGEVEVDLGVRALLAVTHVKGEPSARALGEGTKNARFR